MSRPALAMAAAILAGLLLAAFPLPASAQAPADAPLLADPAGDVVLAVRDTPASTAVATHPSLDLRSLRAIETPSEFTWVLEVEDLRPASEETTSFDGLRYAVAFTHNGREFRAQVDGFLPAFGAPFFLFLDARDAPDAPWTGIWSSFDGVQADPAADTLTFAIPRQALADRDGAAPFPGRVLQDIGASSASGFSESTINVGPQTRFPYTVSDAMPDAGGALASLPVGVGVQQTGTARLFSEVPFRASNGEATTFVFQVEAINLAEEDRTFTLEAVGAPARLSVVVPVSLLAIPAEDSLVVPVLATVPFGHQHGSLDAFRLELRDLQDDASVGRIEMGVRYLEVPQPAGHHDTLYLHPPAGGGGTELLSFRFGRMDTIEGEGEAPVHAQGVGWSPGQQQHSWTYQLSPALQMGLDFDLDRPGRMSIPVGTTLPMAQSQLTAWLSVGSASYDTTVLVAKAESATVDLLPDSEHTFELDFQALEDADRIPYLAGNNLWLDLMLTSVAAVPTLGFAKESAYIAPGASIVLPVAEWHDDVDDALNVAGGPLVTVDGAQERLVNPGEAVVVRVLVENPSDEAVPFGLDVTGANVAWASLPDRTLTVPANGTGTATLVVRAPADAGDGDRADLVVQAFPRGAPSARSLVRIVVEVDTAADHPDDAAVATRLEAKDTPGAPLAAPLALACALVASRSRRRLR